MEYWHKIKNIKKGGRIIREKRKRYIEDIRWIKDSYMLFCIKVRIKLRYERGIKV